MHKGILLAGGFGTRLYPSTNAVNKHLIPIYDKPMIYYSLSTLIKCGCEEILIISDILSLYRYHELIDMIGNLGIKFTFAKQQQPKGIAEAFLIAKDCEYLEPDDSVTLMLGDNVFYGSEIDEHCHILSIESKECNNIFTYRVSDPSRYGILAETGLIIEKPPVFVGNNAVVGLYHYKNAKEVIEVAQNIKPSARGELEITDLNNVFLDRKDKGGNSEMWNEHIPSGNAWFDTGTVDGIANASNFIQCVQERQGILVGSPELTSYDMGNINLGDLKKLVNYMPSCSYKHSLIRIINEEED